MKLARRAARIIILNPGSKGQRFAPKAACLFTLFLLVVVACGGRNEVQDYFDQIPGLGESNESVERFGELLETEAQLDPTRITRLEVVELVEQLFVAAKSAYEDTRLARDQMRSVVPPEQCEKGQLKMLQILLLEEEMLLNFTQYYRFGLEMGVNRPELLDRANALRREAELAKQAGIREVLACK